MISDSLSESIMPGALRLSLLAIVAFIPALLAAVTGFGGAAVLLPMLVSDSCVRSDADSRAIDWKRAS